MYKSITQLSFFYNDEIENLGDLEKLNFAIRNIDDEKLVVKLNQIRGNGRNDFPVGAMLNSFYAMIIFKHPTVNSLISELSRNSQLRHICGFVPFWSKDKYGISKLILYPSDGAYSNFFKNLMKCEAEYKEIFEELVEYMSVNIKDFGKEQAGDGKIISSYANKPSKKNEKDGRRDVDADFTIKQYTASNMEGETVVKKKTYFGYRVHAIVDVATELPIAINITKASISEKPEMLKLIKETIKKHPLIKENIKIFLADKGYDFTELIEYLEEENIKPIIDICNHWKEEEYKVLNEYNDIEYTYDGNVYYVDETDKK